MLESLLSFLRDHLAPPVVAPPFSTPPDSSGIMAVKDGYKVQATPRPTAQRRVRRHAFEDIDSLAAFCVRHFDPRTTEILAAPGKVGVLSGLGWTQDVVTCGMAHDPAFVAWRRVFGVALDQRKAYAAINALREEVVDGSGALAAFRTLEVHSKGEFKMNLLASGAVEFVSSANGVSVTGKIPETITVRVPVYRGGPALDIEVQIVPDLSATPPTFALQPRNLDQACETAFEAELARLREGLGGDAGGFLVSRGSLAQE